MLQTEAEYNIQLSPFGVYKYMKLIEIYNRSSVMHVLQYRGPYGMSI